MTAAVKGVEEVLDGAVDVVLGGVAAVGEFDWDGGSTAVLGLWTPTGGVAVAVSVPGGGMLWGDVSQRGESATLLLSSPLF
jgi:hypothetical protein